MSYNTLVEAQAVDGGLTQEHLDGGNLYLNGVYTWPGSLADSTQTEDWPRVDCDGNELVDANGRTLSGVPDAVKAAELVAAGLLKSGSVLLPTDVATSTSASTQNSQLIEDTVKSADGDQVTLKWSPSSTETSTESVQTLNDQGIPIIAKIELLLKPITSIGIKKGNVYRRYRA